MIKVTTKRQDAEAYLGRKLLSDLEDGRLNGNIIKTLTYLQQLLDEIEIMPRDDVGEKVRTNACYASANVQGAIDRCIETKEDRQRILQQVREEQKQS